jgi:hypothetical protein
MSSELLAVQLFVVCQLLTTAHHCSLRAHTLSADRSDFANGFLVAEIFSRYYPGDINMHSFDNGTSLPKKLDNWTQLEKFFKKKGVDVDRPLMDSVIHCKENGALSLVERIYTALTSRQ